MISMFRRFRIALVAALLATNLASAWGQAGGRPVESWGEVKLQLFPAPHFSAQISFRERRPHCPDFAIGELP